MAGGFAAWLDLLPLGNLLGTKGTRQLDKIRLFWSDYRFLSLTASAVMFSICVTLLLVPSVIHWLFQIDSTTGSDVMSRRAAMLFLGLAVIVYRTRDATDAAARRTVCTAIICTMGGLALVGFFDYMRGTVGIGIWLAIVVEVVMVAGFARFLK